MGRYRERHGVVRYTFGPLLTESTLGSVDRAVSRPDS
jgi:hypothetical protein